MHTVTNVASFQPDAVRMMHNTWLRMSVKTNDLKRIQKAVKIVEKH